MAQNALTIPEALAILRQTLAVQCPGFVPVQITIKGASGKLSWPFLDHGCPEPATSRSATADDFLPNEVQTAILESLEGKFMRTEQLAAAVATALGIDDARNRMFKKPGGIQELKDKGMVKNHPRRGYYSTVAPPEEIA